MKIKGADFIDWYDNHWPGEDWYHDEAEIETHDIYTGACLLDPNETYDVADLGLVLYQGDDLRYDDAEMDMAKLLRLYLRNRDFSLLTIEVPKSKVAEVKAMLKTMEVKVR